VPDDPASVKLLTVRQVAEALAVHPRSIWRLVASGTLPRPVRLGPKLVRWRLRDVESAIERAVR